MRGLCTKYARKLVAQGVCAKGEPLVGGLDDELVWNRDDPRTKELARLFDLLSLNSLVFARPAEPYASIIDFLAARYPEFIQPEDTETRTFLHDIPVCREFSAEALAEHLARRKSAIVPGHGVIAPGTVSPEQGFVFFSSTLFSCFVLFFSEYLAAARRGEPDPEFRAVFERAAGQLPSLRTDSPDLATGPFTDDDSVIAAMAEAGRAVVHYGLVDSFFGNVSCRLSDVVHISQTGSSLDELEGCIDPCPLDGSTTHGLTASSELSAHEGVYRSADALCILHGHPKFSVILSMDCERAECPNRGHCHVACTECRTVEGVPVVPGEVGTGPTGLCNTLPPALAASGVAVVHGHGVFATGGKDFNEPFGRLLDFENRCRALYFERVATLSR
ncbi:class II aldolase/adducin family protein [Pseudodesulfovibrio sp.]|uniref:class II aldolase/adducin family protein n=1 Tax=unclassified Pseudodesulfovibrio TaxID=2661612 RepID=UPI003AFFCACB